jgi:protein-S-isoprenylcysteine O-methyltransferase Ste14
MTFGLIFISQYWLVVIIGTLRIFMLYYVILAEERMDINRFGSLYRDYQKRVPRLNFIKGILKRSN